MPKYAIIENNVVINVIEAEQDYAVEHGLIEVTENAGIGWTLEGSTFVEPNTITQPPSQISKEELFAQLQALQSQIQALE